MRLYTFLLGVFSSIYPFLILDAAESVNGHFRTFAADSFYYFQIAENYAKLGFFSFDGSHPTNGFHPLWQVILAFFSFISADKSQLLSISYWTCVSLVGISAGIISLTFYRMTRRPLISVFFCILGPVGVVSAFLNLNFGNLWSFVNAMESGCSLVFFGFLLYTLLFSDFYENFSIKSLSLVSFFCILIVFSRLDDIFLLPALLAPIAFNKAFLIAHRNRVIFFITLVSIPILGYMLSNYINFQSIVPVSGQAKRGFAGAINTLAFADVFLPLNEIISETKIYWSESAWRVLYMFLPAATVVVFLIFLSRQDFLKETSIAVRRTFLALALYVLMKFIYNFFLVGTSHQGHWYFPISIVICNFFCLIVITRLWKRSLIKENPLFTFFSYRMTAISVSFIFLAISAYINFKTGNLLIPILFFSVCIYVLLLCLSSREPCESSSNASLFMASLILFLVFGNSFSMSKIRNDYNGHYYRLWESRERISSELNALSDNLKLVSYDDGIIAFSLPFEVLSGIGLALDPAASSSKQNGELLLLAEKRGFEYIASLNYFKSTNATPGSLVFEDKKPFWMSDLERDTFTFKLAYRDEATGLKIVEFKRKSLTSL